VMGGNKDCVLVSLGPLMFDDTLDLQNSRI
jgi:hypothetical protein